MSASASVLSLLLLGVVLVLVVLVVVVVVLVVVTVVNDVCQCGRTTRMHDALTALVASSLGTQHIVDVDRWHFHSGRGSAHISSSSFAAHGG